MHSSHFNFFSLFLSFSFQKACVHMCIDACVTQHVCGDKRTALGSQFFPSIMWTLGLLPSESPLAQNTYFLVHIFFLLLDGVFCWGSQLNFLSNWISIISDCLKTSLLISHECPLLSSKLHLTDYLYFRVSHEALYNWIQFCIRHLTLGSLESTARELWLFGGVMLSCFLFSSILTSLSWDLHFWWIGHL